MKKVEFESVKGADYEKTTKKAQTRETPVHWLCSVAFGGQIQSVADCRLPYLKDVKYRPK